MSPAEVQIEHHATPTSFTELAVAIGRVEEKVSRINAMEDRLREVESTVQRLDARQPQRVSGWTIASAVMAIPASLVALFLVVAQMVNPA